ncbi:Uncharacterised protein [Raoultella ornithinolytica]|nr:Uncharacterised protein [Raoultella ornithinolytica]
MMATVWLFLALLNLVVFTAFIIPRKQPAEASPLFPVAAIKLLRFMWLVPILIFGYSLSLVATISLIEWGCLAIAVIGNILMIKGKLDLGRCHTWAGYYLPGVSAIRTGIFRWLPPPYVYRHRSGHSLVQPDLRHPPAGLHQRDGVDLLSLYHHFFTVRRLQRKQNAYAPGSRGINLRAARNRFSPPRAHPPSESDRTRRAVGFSGLYRWR